MEAQTGRKATAVSAISVHAAKNIVRSSHCPWKPNSGWSTTPNSVATAFRVLVSKSIQIPSRKRKM